jgi:chorismate synthase
MFTGLDIQIDFAMYEDERENKKKIKALKKGGKSLGGKLLKKFHNVPIEEGVKPRTDFGSPDDPTG